MKRKSISLCTLFLLCLMAACSKKEQSVPTLFASEQLKQMLPYGNEQTVRFISSQGALVEAVVNVKKGTTKKSACATCDSYVYEEYIEYNLMAGAKTFVHISIDNRPIVFMSIYSPEDNYQIGNGFDFATIEGTSQPSCNAPRQTCLDTLVYSGATYNRVLEIISGAANNSNMLTKAYYSVSRGLIGFTYGNGITYRLQ